MRGVWLVVALAAAGCGVNEEQLRRELGSIRTWAGDEARALEDRVATRLGTLEAKVEAGETRGRGDVAGLGRRLEELGKRIAALEADVAAVKSVADDVNRLRAESASRLDDMRKVYTEFTADIGKLEAKVRLTQDKYKEIIQKNIQSLKDQYTYLATLLRQIEAGGEGGGAPPPGDGEGK